MPMPQESQPIADVITGEWVPTPVYSQINDPYPGDSTFVSSDGLPQGDTFEVRLKPLYAPEDGDHTLTVRMRKLGVGVEWTWISLLQAREPLDPLVIATRRVDPANTFSDYSMTLTLEETEQISNYAALILRVTALRDRYSSSSASGSETSTSGSSVSESSVSNSSSSSSYSNSSSSNSSSSSSSSINSFSGSSTSGSYSGSGIVVACCPNPLPAVLYVTFSGSLTPLGTVTIVFNGVRWVGTSNGCGTVIVNLDPCSSGNLWYLWLSGDGYGGGTFYPNCTPFYWEGSIAAGGNAPCSPGGYAIITE